MASQFAITKSVQFTHPCAKRKIFRMFKFYMDDSGTHGDARVSIAAGYIARARSWRKFEEDWRWALDKFKVPLDRFHAKNFYPKPPRGSWFDDRWENAGRHEEFAKFMANLIAAHHRIQPVGIGILVDDFMACPEDLRRWLTGAEIEKGVLKTSGSPNSAFFYSFNECMKKAATGLPRGNQIHPSFGLGSPLSGYALDLINRMAKKKKTGRDFNWDAILGDPVFPLAAKTPELQAADYLAYVMYHYITEMLKAGRSGQDLYYSPPSPILEILIKNRQDASSFKLLNHEAIREALEVARRKSIPKSDKL